ncbi:PAS domain S-box protein [Polaribacter litorisediminis]|uniref:sensor histidine kinase n=1 Tax=Polaribacter litorisediminis TaxID=1908341 RepID=UPI001CBDE767|nr:PAS domain S-box protein [Polaribacter litorisediminis]UAM97576.1 PAS domain S-box protein [Polaribacter litorisediminis]
MKQPQLNNTFLDQSKDSIWIVNLDFQLMYANKTYLNILKTIIGREPQLYESVFHEKVEEYDLEKWKAYYTRALKGAYFDIEDHYYNLDLEETQYGQTTFEPLTGDDNTVFAVACRWKNITNIVKNKNEEKQLLDASLDVFCTINKDGNFVYVNANSLKHWGYLPEELIGKAYKDLILEEDVPKTMEAADNLFSGQDLKSFSNRYKKKNGGIAYNLWSARWDHNTNLMYCSVRDNEEKIEQEEKTQQSEQRFKALVQEGSDLISILDTEGNYLYTSPTNTALLGFVPDEKNVRNIFEFIHPDDAKRVRASLQKVVTENKVIVEPFRFQNYKKEWRWLESVLTNTLDNFAVNGIIVNSQDITDKIKEKQQLKLLESVITHTKDSVLITEAEPFDEPGPKILFVNEAFTKMTGYTAAEVIGKTPRILQGPKSDKAELAKLSKAIRNWQSYEITTINYKKNGEEFWINFAVTPVSDENGWYTHWIAIERDVTLDKQREENLIIAKEKAENSEAKFKSYVNQSPIAVYTTDIEGKCIYANKTWLEIADMNLEEALGDGWMNAIHPEDEKDVETNWNTSIQSGGKWQYEYRFINKHKKVTWVQGTAKELFNEENKLIGYLGTNINITEQKEAEKALNKTKEELIASEERFREMFNHMSNGVCRYTAVDDGKKFIMADINFAGERLINTKKADFLGKSLLDIFPKMSHQGLTDTFKRVWETGVSEFYDEQLYEDKNLSAYFKNFVYKLSSGDIIAIFEDVTERKLAEQKIIKAKETAEENERKMNEAQQLARLGSWYYNVAKDEVEWSDETYKIWGIKPEDGPLKFNDHKKAVHPKDWQRFENVVKNAIKNGIAYQIEMRILKPNGAYKTVSAIATIIFDKHNKVIALKGTIQDISERKVIENKLKIAKEKAEKSQFSMTEAGRMAKIGYWSFDKPTGTMSWSNSLHQMYGSDPKDPLPSFDEILNSFNEESKQKLIEVSLALDNTGIAYEQELKLTNLKNEKRWIRNFGQQMRNDKNEVIGTRGVLQDITDAKKLQLALELSKKNIEASLKLVEKSERSMSEASKIAKIGYWEYHNLNDTFIWSDYMYQIFAVNPKEGIPSQVEILKCFHEDSVKKLKQAILELTTKGISYDIEVKVVNFKNEELWARMIVQPVYNHQNEIIGRRGMMQNITDAKKILLELKNSKEIAENALVFAEKSEYSMNEAGKMAKIGYWEYNRETVVLSWSDAIYNIYGSDPKNGVPTLLEILSVFTEQSRKKLLNATSNLTNNGVSYDIDLELINFKNKRIWIRDLGQAVYNHKNKIIGRRGMTQDITAAKNAQLEVLKAKEKIQNSELKFKSYTEKSPLTIYTTNLKGEWIYVNQTWTEMTGMPLKESLGKKWMTALHPDDVALIKNKWFGSFASRGKWKYEYRFIAKSGEIVWVEGSARELYNDKNELIGHLGVNVNITERKKAEQEKNSLQKTLENSLNEIYIFDSETLQFTYANKGALLNLGYSEKEVKLLTVIDIKPEFTETYFRELVTPLMQGEKNKIIFFTKHQRKDGSLYPAEIHLQLVTEGNHKSFLAIVLDISERKKAEEMYRLLSDHTNDLVCMHDRDRKFTYISPSIKNLLGFEQTELLHKEVFEIVHQEDIEPLKKAIQERIFKGLNTDAFTFRARHKEGHYVWLEAIGSPVIENKKIVSFVTSTRNINQWMLAKQEIEEYQSSLQRLTSEVSLIEEKQKKEIAANIHDHLSQSLVISKMRISDLEKRVELKSAYEDLDFIKSHISKALENSRKITYELSPPILYQLGLVDALDWFAEDTQEKYGIEFQFNSNVDRLNLDEFQSILIFRCVQEVVTNAIKYAEASLMTLEFIKEEEAILIFIKDNGNGFDTSILKKSSSSSSGFGLFAVQERVRNMKGDFTITSEINKGTTIKIYVPL